MLENALVVAFSMIVKLLTSRRFISSSTGWTLDMSSRHKKREAIKILFSSGCAIINLVFHEATLQKKVVFCASVIMPGRVTFESMVKWNYGGNVPDKKHSQ